MNKKNSILNMKKILILLFLSLFITSCFWESDDVKKAKQDLGISGYEEVVVDKIEDKKTTEEIVLDTNSDLRVKVNLISWDKMLVFDELKYNDFRKWESKISWKTLWIIDKITVDFSNEDSDFPNNSYILKKFKKWDDNFKYNANSKFKVLDFWLNKYIITANYGDLKSIYEVLVLVSEKNDKILEQLDNNDTLEEKIKEEEWFTRELIWEEDNLVYTDLPKWWDFWNVVKLWENSFTYSDIKWLEIKKEIFQDINCWKNEDTDKYFVTEFLWERISSWYYWNTCRDIVKWKWISFFVARLDWNNYIYEKNYIDTSNWFYWTYEIEKGELFTGEDLTFSEKLEKLNIKRKELKENNAENKNRLSVVDNLFKKIAK